MAEPINEAACVARHEAYPFDIGRNELSALQRRRLTLMSQWVRPADSVLDVGCNSGYLVEFLPKTCRCYGVDVAPSLVATARTRLVDARVAPAERLPQATGSMDVVFLGEILEHVYEPDAVLREACRVARRLVVGSTPHEAGSWGTATVAAHAFHVRCYTDASLRLELAPYGDVEIEILHGAARRPQMYVFAIALRRDPCA